MTVRLAPYFLPSSASMGSDFPAGRSPRTIEEPSFCTSDWVRLTPDMKRKYLCVDDAAVRDRCAATLSRRKRKI